MPSTQAPPPPTLGHVSTAKHVLVVLERDDVVSWKSLRNVDAVHLLEPGQLNTYDVLVSDDVVFTEAALEQFVETRGNGCDAGRHGRRGCRSRQGAGDEGCGQGRTPADDVGHAMTR